MTLKLRLAAMMILLLMAVLALQYLLVQREEQALMDRLSTLSLGVDESTRQFSRRAHELSYRPLSPDHLLDELFGDTSTARRSRAEFFVLSAESTVVRTSATDCDSTPGTVEDIVTQAKTSGSGRTFFRRVTSHPAGLDSSSQMTVEVLMDVGDSTGRQVQRVRQWTSGKNDADMMLINLPVPSPAGDAAWTVRMGVPMGGFRDELDRSRKRGFLWLAGLLGVGIVGAIGVALQFTRPIQKLEASFRRVQQGDLDVTLKPERNDEIGGLTRSFNQMVERLRATRRMEQRLIEAEREAAVGRLAAGVAHEVRNPLNAIQLTVQQMRDRLADGPGAGNEARIDAYLGTVTAEIARLERLVGSFLDLSRTGSVAHESIDLGESLATSVQLFESEAKTRDIHFTSEAPRGLRFAGDPIRLATVWNNLISNALQATPAGGTVHVAAEAGPDEVTVRVTDSGPGIPEDRLNHIWEPFYSARPGGVGLGLSIVRAVVERHGGAVDVTSRPGAGSLFTVRLPIRPKPDGPPPVTGPGDASA